jgi:nicotinate-nucleotide adenylyltransferase
MGGFWHRPNSQLSAYATYKPYWSPPMIRIGCFGGTFDPVHKGHVALAVAAARFMALDRLIVLPVGNPYYRGRMPIASPEQRNIMLELAFASEPYFAQSGCKVVIDSREQHRNGPTYTIDTLIELHNEVALEFKTEVSLVWIIGSDAFAQLPTWTRFEQLFDYAHFAVATRIDNGSIATTEMPENALKNDVFKHKAENATALFCAGTHGAWLELAVDLPDASSTRARAAAKQMASLDEFLAPPVAQFILDNKLYQ